MNHCVRRNYIMLTRLEMIDAVCKVIPWDRIDWVSKWHSEMYAFFNKTRVQKSYSFSFIHIHKKTF